MKVLVTGATGFVGQPLIAALLGSDASVVALVKAHSDELPEEVEQVTMGDLRALVEPGELSETVLKKIKAILEGVEVVIHLAARVHVMNDSLADPLVEFRTINRDVTLALAKFAAQFGVKRFLFISSIKVNGEMTSLGRPFKATDNFVPHDSYGLSKYEAEQGLLALAESSGMEVVIIRPPLVYGPGVRANFATMTNWVKRGVPLPFGAIDNCRSLVSLDNLVSFILHCADHPKAANEVFLISDDEDVSTPQLLRKVASAFGKKCWLIPVPVSWMRFLAGLAGKEAVVERLFGSLQVDPSKAQKLLGWRPVITMDEQLNKMADSCLNEKTV
jgi:nucleoside-diphosphate-sugar epimerase